jgi:hypothetical protein
MRHGADGLCRGLHADNDDPTFGRTVALPFLDIPEIILFPPLVLGQRQFELRTVAPPTLFFAPPDFVDDPWL